MNVGSPNSEAKPRKTTRPQPSAGQLTAPGRSSFLFLLTLHGASKQRDGIPVERYTKLRGARHLEPLHEVTTHARELAGMSGFEQDVPAPAALDALDRARRRADDDYFLAGARCYELA